MSLTHIPLNDTDFAIVDTASLPTLFAASLKWRKSATGYAVFGRAVNKRCVTTQMHRLLLNAPKGYDVDHINGNPLDNRLSNLRLATRSQNKANAKKNVNGTSSKYKGVSWDKKSGVWVAFCGTTLYRGPSETDAAMAYNKAALLKYGVFAAINNLDVTHGHQPLLRAV